MRPDNITWSQLTKLQKSLGPNALLTLPILAFIISSVPFEWFQANIINNWRMNLLFWGALLFIIGQLFVWNRRPIEFSREIDIMSEIHDIKAMSNSLDAFQNRVVMLENLCKRYNKEIPRGFNSVELQIAETRINQAKNATADNWQELFPLIVTSQYRLRDYDYYNSRIVSLYTLAIGTILMLLPTCINILAAIYLIIKEYLNWFLSFL